MLARWKRLDFPHFIAISVICKINHDCAFHRRFFLDSGVYSGRILDVFWTKWIPAPKRNLRDTRSNSRSIDRSLAPLLDFIPLGRRGSGLVAQLVTGLAEAGVNEWISKASWTSHGILKRITGLREFSLLKQHISDR